MDREDFLSIVSLCLYAHPIQQDETLAKAPGTNNVGVLVGLNPKISSTKVDGEWWNIFCSLQKKIQLMHSFSSKNCVYTCINFVSNFDHLLPPSR